jgi:hypothetical protein
VRVPIQSGIAPINLFMFSARLISLWRFAIPEGKSPDSWLYAQV